MISRASHPNSKIPAIVDYDTADGQPLLVFESGIMRYNDLSISGHVLQNAHILRTHQQVRVELHLSFQSPLRSVQDPSLTFFFTLLHFYFWWEDSGRCPGRRASLPQVRLRRGTKGARWSLYVYCCRFHIKWTLFKWKIIGSAVVKFGLCLE